MHFGPAIMGVLTDIFVGICVAIVTGVTARMSSQVSKLKLEQAKENNALKIAMQSILRDRLYTCYSVCRHKGGASIDDRENFENLWAQYHALGANGVMDDVHKKFLSLPVCDERDEK